MAYKWAPYFRWIPTWLGNWLSIHGGSEKVRKLAQMFGCRYDPYFLTRRQFSPAWIARLLARGVRPDLVKLYADQMEAVDTAGIDFGADVINRSSWMEVRHDNLSMYMRDGFQLGEAVGLAGRYPLMDASLAQLLFTIPGEWKCDPQVSKPLLVKAAGAGLPDEIVHRPKQGFSLPFDKYCRAGLKDELEAFVRTGGTGLFKQAEIAAIWQRYLAGKVSWMRIWHLFVVDDWCRRNGVVSD
jgi:asparagine synthase (glutamine-hydrolysing)